MDRADFTAYGSSAHVSSHGATPAKGAGAAGGAAITAPALVASDVNERRRHLRPRARRPRVAARRPGRDRKPDLAPQQGDVSVLIAFVVNLIGATAVVGFGNSPGGFDGDLIDEGFVLGCYFALACWARDRCFGAGRSAAQGPVVAGQVPERSRLALPPALLVPAVAAALGAALVVPLVIGNWSVVHRADKPFADRYAETAFADLPPHAALFMLGAELTQPLIYRQVVYHQRPDVRGHRRRRAGV